MVRPLPLPLSKKLHSPTNLSRQNFSQCRLSTDPRQRRMELSDVIRRIEMWNDSTSTNPEALVRRQSLML